MMRLPFPFPLCLALNLAVSGRCLAIDPPPTPAITNINLSGNTVNLRFPLYPAAEAYTILSSSNLNQPFTADTNFSIGSYRSLTTNGSTTVTNVGYEWRRQNSPSGRSFFQLQVTPLSSNALLTATVLNRLAYGQTPDELERVAAIGPEAFIAEQLAPWNITEDVELTHPNLPAIEARFVEVTNFVYNTNATIADLRAWHALRAIGAKRQFLEILLQFLENHFVTQWSKSRNVYFDTYYDNGNQQDILATQFEYLENQRWRRALLNPACTFYDLLKISAESPAMLIYLDTYSSKGNGSNVANENYAREIMELFCMGVDNGYDQNDITVQSRIWTGWTIEKVALNNAFNPFAPRTTTIIPGSTNTSTTTRSNLYGAWVFHYNPASHNSAAKTIFPGKTVPARYGTPWTTKKYAGNSTPGLYQIYIPGHSTSDNNGIYEGYQFMTNLADYPFTEEYISIKLCRLLVHDDFPNPSNDPTDPAYDFYNYAGGNLSPEAELVHACMLTWETNSPRGQIWKVLKTITDSALFRTHAGSRQKIKTPFEYAISAIRALRSSTNGSNLAGSFTAFSDGYAIHTPLTRMGNMLLFDRDSPDGYPEAGPPWISAGTLCERNRFVQSFCIASGQSGHSGSQGGTGNDAQNSICDVVGLLKAKLPSNSWKDAEAVADYFISILFPGEGSGNLEFYRQSAINFLNTSDTGSPSPFANLTVSTTANSTYDNRVRGMVGGLMTFQRFQEQ